MAGMVANPCQPLDDLGDARERPQIGREPVRARAGPQRALDGRELRRIQLRPPARAARPFEAGAALGFPRMEPVVGTHPGHSQRLRHCPLRFAPCEQPRSAQPTRLHRGQIPCGCRHASACDGTRDIH